MDGNQPRPQLSNDEAYLARMRDSIPRKDPIEEIHFEYLSEALALLGVSGDIYAGVSDTAFSPETTDKISHAFQDLQASAPEDDLTNKLYRLWDYLAEVDPLEKADLIYVFGGISKLAVKEAIRLKLENYAPKILFSGKHGSYMKDVVGLSEAEKYAQLAIESGVSKEDILMEKESINTVENILNSCKLLHDLGELPKTIIAVSLPYHMKRAALTMRGGMDFPFRLIRHPGPSAKYTRDTYFKDEKGWSYVCYEYIKLRMSRLGGHF